MPALLDALSVDRIRGDLILLSIPFPKDLKHTVISNTKPRNYVSLSLGIPVLESVDMSNTDIPHIHSRVYRWR